MHIIFLILKIIGWILLIILGLLVLVTCLVLFTPLRYQVRASCDGDVSSLAAEADLSVFFHLVHASVRYVNQKLSWQFWLAWKKFSSEPGTKSEDEIKHEVKKAAEDVRQTGEEAAGGIIRTAVDGAEEEHINDEGTDAAGDSPIKEEPFTAKEPVTESVPSPAKEKPATELASSHAKEKPVTESASSPAKEKPVTESTPSPAKERHVTESALSHAKKESRERTSKVKERKKKESLFSKIKGMIEKLKCTFEEICGKIETLRKKKDVLVDFVTDDAHVGALKKVLAELKKLLRRLMPKKFQADVRFGFEDPSITGRVLAGISMIYPSICEHARISPDFQQEVLEGSLFVKGRVRACIFAAMLCNLLLNANVRRTLLDVKNFSLDV